MRNVAAFIICCLLLLEAGAQESETTVYKHVRPDGTVEFSDEPTAGQPVEVPSIQTYTPPPLPPSTPKPAVTPKSRLPAERPAVRYDLKITEPAPDATVFFDEKGVAVAVAIKPPLQPGHAVAVYLDGRQAARGTATRYLLTGVVRGTHTVTAAIEANGGATLLRSPSVTFYLRQHTKRP